MSDSAKADPTAVETLGAGTLWAIVLGCAAALAGAVSGFVLARHRTVVRCPDVTEIDNGADPNCYGYPDVALGLSLLFASIALLLLIVLAARILIVVQRGARTQPD